MLVTLCCDMPNFASYSRMSSGWWAVVDERRFRVRWAAFHTQRLFMLENPSSRPVPKSSLNCK